MKKLIFFITITFGLFFLTGLVLAAPTTTTQRTLLPEITNTYDLGSPDKVWRNLYVQSCTGCGGGGGGSPAGADTQIQFNNGGAFGASSNFTFNTSTAILNLNGIETISNANASTTASNALVITEDNQSGHTGLNQKALYVAATNSGNSVVTLTGIYGLSQIDNDVTFGKGLAGELTLDANGNVTHGYGVEGLISETGNGATASTVAALHAAPVHNPNTNVIDTAYGALIEAPGDGLTQWTLGVLGGNNYLSGLTTFGSNAIPGATIDDRGTLNVTGLTTLASTTINGLFTVSGPLSTLQYDPTISKLSITSTPNNRPEIDLNGTNNKGGILEFNRNGTPDYGLYDYNGGSKLALYSSSFLAGGDVWNYDNSNGLTTDFRPTLISTIVSSTAGIDASLRINQTTGLPSFDVYDPSSALVFSITTSTITANANVAITYSQPAVGMGLATAPSAIIGYPNSQVNTSLIYPGQTIVEDTKNAGAITFSGGVVGQYVNARSAQNQIVNLLSSGYFSATFFQGSTTTNAYGLYTEVSPGGNGAVATNAYGLEVGVENVSGNTVTKLAGIHINNQSGATKSWGLANDADNNYHSGSTTFGAQTTPTAIVDVRGTFNVTGSSTIATTTFNGNINSNILPSSDNTFDLGTSTLRWRSVNATTVSSTNIIVNGISVNANLNATTASIGGGLLTADNCSTVVTTTVPGAVVGNNVSCTRADGTFPTSGSYCQSVVATTNVVSTQVCALITVTPSADTYTVTVTR